MISITTLAAQTLELALRPIPKPAPNPAVAYVYVSQSPATSGPNQVFGFAAHENGALTPIEGSPFDADVWSLAVNGKYLFAGNTNGLSIDTYAIEPDGALRYIVSNDIPQPPSGEVRSGYDPLFLDHTGANLYSELEYGDCNDAFVSFAIDKATGTLALTPGFQWLEEAKWSNSYTVSANDEYIYVAASDMYNPEVDTIKRESNGTTALPWRTDPAPVAQPTQYFSPFLISADPLNHVAVAFAPECGPCDGGWYNGWMQLGVYTADAKGNLTTTSTYKNMPSSMFGPNQSASDMRMSPSGKLLAVSGGSGLQVSHFNGGDPITPYATLVRNPNYKPGLDNNPYKELYWDNDNHLLAIIVDKLYVFTVTPTSITEAPGSPYSIPGFSGAQYLTVQPLPLE